jgi:hypothetical protein
MVDGNKIAIGALSIALLASLGYTFLDPSPSHFCEERKLTAYCYDLSESGITCYTLPAYKGAKRCFSLWERIPESEENVERMDLPSRPEKDFIKDPNGVDCYPKGYIERRMNCNEL